MHQSGGNMPNKITPSGGLTWYIKWSSKYSNPWRYSTIIGSVSLKFAFWLVENSWLNNEVVNSDN